jgi:glycosyltransferase involved in cell wall biosynthesis
VDKAVTEQLDTAAKRVPVTVVIPCFRCENTIDGAVASVLQQSALPVELILVEDCSGDDGRTLARLRQIQSQYGLKINIDVLAQPLNRGPGEARNAGWATASQPLIAFLDADDTWHPEKLARQSRIMLAHPELSLSFHDTVILERSEKPSLSPAAMKVQPLRLTDMLLSNRVATRSVMLRTAITQRFPLGLRYAEDYHLWLQILASGQRAARLMLPLAASYKDDFGAGGLSGNLAAMHVGVQQCFSMLHQDGLLNTTQFRLARSVEMLKYWRRLALMALRRCSSLFFAGPASGKVR